MDDDTARPHTAAEALSIIERQQARTGRALAPDLPLMNTVWGLTVFVTPPAHILVLAIGAGGGMLVLGRVIATRAAHL
jgi:hypothetical protein